MPPKKPVTIEWSSNDFLSKSEKLNVKKRKSPLEVQPAKKKIKVTAVADDETRGHMTLFCKSKSSVEAQQKKNKEKKKVTEPTATASSLSMMIKDGETLVVFDDSVANAKILTLAEQKQLEKRINSSKSGNEPVIFKLQWRDRDGATMIGIVNDKKHTFKLSSKLTEEQTFTVEKRIWLSTKESIASVALHEIKGKTDLLAIVPDYKGTVRLLLNGEVSGTFGLEMK